MEHNNNVLTDSEWNELKKNFKSLLDKNGKLSARRLNSSKGKVFREKYPIFDDYSFSRIFYMIEHKTFNPEYCKHCGKEASFDERLKEFKDHCFECRYSEREAWNKGLTKETNESMRVIGEKVAKKKKGRPLTEKEWDVIHKNAEIHRNREYKKEQFEKAAETNLKRYGVRSYLSIAQPLGLEAQKKKYGNKFWAGSEKRKENIDKEMEKIRQTLLEKTDGKYNWASQIPKVKEKKAKTDKENGNGISKLERKSVKEIQEKVFEVFSQYWDERYPFKCDAYLPEYDLFIEFNYDWTHGGHLFNIDSQEDLERAKHWQHLVDIEYGKSNGQFYKNALNTWTIRDIEKFLFAEENNLNYLTFYTEEDFHIWLDSIKKEHVSINLEPLIIQTKEDDLKKSFLSLNKKKKIYNPSHKQKELVVPFIQELFYSKEQELLSNYEKRFSLIQNRVLSKNKRYKELTPRDLLDGATISGKMKGFSTFSPLIVKAFIRDFNISSIYDPFGGWGSRMLGAWDIRYHYNDANESLVEKVKEMCQFYSRFQEPEKKTFSSEEASSFIPDEKFGAVFTCPPYFNVEDYNFQYDSSKLFPEYKEWIEIWWRNVVRNSKQVAPIFAYVISTDFEEDMNRVLEEEGYTLLDKKTTTVKKKNHLSSSKEESLFIYELL